MKYRIVFSTKEQDFIDILRSFGKFEQFDIINNELIIYSGKSSTLRAKVNLVLRLLGIYEKFKDFFK